jgi:hypothetical protein
MPSLLSAVSNLTIKAKIIAAFAIVLAITVGLGLFAAHRLGTVNETSVDLRDGITGWCQPIPCSRSMPKPTATASLKPFT